MFKVTKVHTYPKDNDSLTTVWTFSFRPVRAILGAAATLFCGACALGVLGALWDCPTMKGLRAVAL